MIASFAAAYLARPIVAPVTFALFIVAIVWPLQAALQRRLPKGVALVVTLLVAIAVIAVRRGGALHAFDTINHFFTISEMIVVGSSYWNFAFGRLNAGAVYQRSLTVSSASTNTFGSDLAFP